MIISLFKYLAIGDGFTMKNAKGLLVSYTKNAAETARRGHERPRLIKPNALVVPADGRIQQTPYHRLLMFRNKDLKPSSISREMFDSADTATIAASFKNKSDPQNLYSPISESRMDTIDFDIDEPLTPNVN